MLAAAFGFGDPLISPEPIADLSASPTDCEDPMSVRSATDAPPKQFLTRTWVGPSSPSPTSLF